MDKDDVVSLCRALVCIEQQLHRIADGQSRVIEYFAIMKPPDDAGFPSFTQVFGPDDPDAPDNDIPKDPSGDREHPK